MMIATAIGCIIPLLKERYSEIRNICASLDHPVDYGFIFLKCLIAIDILFAVWLIVSAYIIQKSKIRWVGLGLISFAILTFLFIFSDKLPLLWISTQSCADTCR
jgi:hypothetical protein